MVIKYDKNLRVIKSLVLAILLLESLNSCQLLNISTELDNANLG